MERVMVACPRTGRPVWTGAEMSEAMLGRVADGRAPHFRCFRCRACGRLHRWHGAEAWLAGGGPAPGDGDADDHAFVFVGAATRGPAAPRDPARDTAVAQDGRDPRSRSRMLGRSS